MGTYHKGQPLPRREDGRFLSGHARYVADLFGSDSAQAVFVRSAQPRARLRRVDVTAAREADGVIAAYTGADLADSLGSLQALHIPDPEFARVFSVRIEEHSLSCLAAERVSYVGEPIAVVVADGRHLAEDAAELVEVEYDAEQPVVDAAAALAEGAPPVAPHVGDNIAVELNTEFGDVDAAVAQAATVVHRTFRVGRHAGMPLECRGVLASWDGAGGRVEVTTSTQVPHVVQSAICHATGWPTSEVRVRVPDVGGGFGTKANVYPEEVVVAVLSRLLRREVAWIEDRAEHFVAAAHSRDQTLEARLAVNDEGYVLGWWVEFVVDLGAGSLWAAGITANTAIHLMGPYRFPSYRVRGQAVLTNKTVTAQYRGAGRPEACFALERSLDMAADKLGLSRAEIRRRNLLGPEDLPYKPPLPYRDGAQVAYDGSDYRATLDACLKLLPPEVMEELRDEYPDLQLGHGVATYVEATGRGPYEAARAQLLPDGTFEIATGAASAGQSHETTLAQVAADLLHVPIEHVRVRGADSDLLPYGVGSFGSRSAVTAGSAVHRACTLLTERAQRLAAELMSNSESGVEVVKGGFEVAGQLVQWSHLARALAPDGELARQGPLDAHDTFVPPTVTWTMGAHAAVVGVDSGTGAVKVLRYVVAHEGGEEINPTVVEGQIRGGVAQGLGGALLETLRYSPEGQPQTSTFADYLLPGPGDVPAVETVHLHGPAERNPLAVKGIGESGTIPVYAALASAVEQALGTPSEYLTNTPLDPGNILRLFPDETSL